MDFLTPSPFLPKLPRSYHMPSKTQCIRILALLVGVIFLGAQFHFCNDLTSTPSGSHVCPVCSTAGSAVATSSPRMGVEPVLDRLELAAPVVSLASTVPRATSPRAPPTL
jgi:hypothetical protein